MGDKGRNDTSTKSSTILGKGKAEETRTTLPRAATVKGKSERDKNRRQRLLNLCLLRATSGDEGLKCLP